jgi:steroid 5-alpha reductase family enzyme
MIKVFFVIVCVAAVMSAVMAGAWLAQRLTQKSGWADAFWTFGVGLAGALFALAHLPDRGPPSARAIIVAGLVALWAARLCAHIVRRTLTGPDDPRYAKLRQDWGQDAPRRMFWFLQTQALFGLLMAVTVFAAAANPRPGLDLRDALGALVMIVAIAGEAISDQTLHRFARDPRNKGRVCDIGLWRWSRHPNYFFEWLGWVAYPIIAIDLSGVYPWGWASLIGPAVMYWLLVHVSGIPPLEEHMLASRGAAFRAYRERTSAFFPWPPKDA